ncbi:MULTISPECIES: YihY/virulence factor BrkB family protein [Mycolicibacterium]|jgi:membrane protein|uniref:Ribonuclease BN n=2 Tax=Mycolicibacterium TaxID=1866885 RepID=A1T7W7_MYCVP|nr:MULTISPECIES: YihY/virulence factor BrkB family protein [Mycolicibacterium]ABM13267.1 ribonuclease BN [Mycolicibacterium vanbaalenii PYR-1]MCV7126638.1 YihY/virulence factor BrkB family protein [Mycolicibacterium vanbaalenii PYR-1]MDN4522434.1 YihY/virulence factor BrkB family protein [Mycolicibacterium austroafricanum]MDW5612717.1 YihY/virulence factor BrkB family protein [Mycolicibacterium sp. D5.8-2]PQP47602.1 ribonuclease BN [Mycolicibacterium austroafricanum]
MDDQSERPDVRPTQRARPSRHHIRHITIRALSKSWDDSIFSESAQAAFWCALSLPPLLLGMLGSLAYVAPLFGPDTLVTIQSQLVSLAGRFFSPNVVSEIIEPTVRDIVRGARGEVVSLGFVISLWAGSSAISAFVDSITEAHDQTPLRHPVRQRFYALGLYVVMLVGAIVAAPFLALGPRKVAEFIPDSWDSALQFAYYPVLFVALVVSVNLLYRVSLPKPLPSHRLLLGSVLAAAVFLIATWGLRVYLTWITSTGYTYGALATPIAFLLFAFFLGFAIMIGAELNAAIEEEFPAPDTHAKRFRWWLEAKAESLNGTTSPTAAPGEPRAAAGGPVATSDAATS